MNKIKLPKGQTFRIIENINEIYLKNGLFKQFYKLIEEESEAHSEFFKIEWAARGFKEPFFIPENEIGEKLKNELIDQFTVLLGLIIQNINFQYVLNYMEYKTARQCIRADETLSEIERKDALRDLELWAERHVHNTI